MQKTPVFCNALDARAGVIWQGSVQLQQSHKQGWGELMECSQTPTTQVNKLQHSLPDPNPKPTHMKAVKRKGWQQVAPIPFLNPDPIAHLIGCSNEAPVIIDGQEVTALIDLGA